MQRSISLIALTLLGSLALPAAAISGPCLTITVDTVSQQVCGSMGEDGKTFEINSPGAIKFLDDSEQTLAQISSFSIGGNIDPYIAFAIAVIDFGAPSTFNFSISTPIVPGAYTYAASSLSGSVTDGGSDGVTAAPIFPALTLLSATAGPGPVNLGVDTGNPCVGAASTSTACAATTAQSLVAGGPFSTLSADLGFTLTGGGDAASFTGRVDIDYGRVPEPSTFALGGIALAALAAFGRRRG